jgi:plastocyanin
MSKTTKGSTMKTMPLLRSAPLAFALLLPGPALAQESTLSVSIKDHRFSPAEIHAPANTAVTLVVKNLDATPEEFESKHLRVEKIIAGGGSATLHLRPLSAGRYRFFGEYHEDTAEGYLVVE